MTDCFGYIPFLLPLRAFLLGFQGVQPGLFDHFGQFCGGWVWWKVEGGSVVSGGKFSVGECAVEEGAMKERASSHVHQAEHDSDCDQ